MLRIICSLCLLFAASSEAAPVAALQFPRIASAGGVYVLPAGVDMPSAKLVHRLLIVVREDQTLPGGINTQLDVAARVVNLYALAKVPPQQVEVAVVVSGKATRMVLSDASYRRQFGKPNPDARLLAELHRAGVQVFVCGQALSRQGYVPGDVGNDVRVSLSAITKMAELQAAGYSLIP